MANTYINTFYSLHLLLKEIIKPQRNRIKNRRKSKVPLTSFRVQNVKKYLL